MVAHKAVAQLKASAEALEQLINYEDDFLTLASSEAELKSRVAEIRDAVAQLPGGHFDLKTKRLAHYSEGVDFIGHRLCHDGSGSIAVPSEENMLRLQKKLAQIEAMFGPDLTPKKGHSCSGAAKAATDILNVLQGWMAAFQSCDTNCEQWNYVQSCYDNFLAEAAFIGVAEPTVKTLTGNQSPYYYKWFDDN